MTQERLNELTHNASIKYTKAVKEEIRQAAAQYGITVPNCTCRNKWFDVLVQIGIRMKKDAVTEEVKQEYKFKLKTRFLFQQHVFDQSTPIADIKWLEGRYPYVFKICYDKVK